MKWRKNISTSKQKQIKFNCSTEKFSQFNFEGKLQQIRKYCKFKTKMIKKLYKKS